MFTKVRYAVFETDSLFRFVESLGFNVLFLETTPEYAIPLRFDTIMGFQKSLMLRALYSRLRSIFLIAKAKPQTKEDLYRSVGKRTEE